MNLHIVMEFCNGGDLTHELKKHRSRGAACVPTERIWPILLQMLLGLHYIHSQRILHRDMKTANVFLHNIKDERGRKRIQVKIGDLGVAKLLGTTASFADTLVRFLPRCLPLFLPQFCGSAALICDLRCCRTARVSLPG